MPATENRTKDSCDERCQGCGCIGLLATDGEGTIALTEGLLSPGNPLLELHLQGFDFSPQAQPQLEAITL